MSFFRRTPEDQIELDRLIAEDMAMVDEEERRVAAMSKEEQREYKRKKDDWVRLDLGGLNCISSFGGDHTSFSLVERVLRDWPDISSRELSPDQWVALGPRENIRQELIGLLPPELRDQYQ